jgi:hypothetical protein
VNRYELFMLKGECHLQLKVPRLAAEAYASAAKEAEKSGTPAEEREVERGVAAAHEMLVKASKAFAYTPRTASDKQKPVPIDILDLASRKRAFAAMLADEMAASDAKVVRAKAAKALPPIAELFKPLDTMEGLERAATGEAARVKALRAELTEAARRAVADALRGIDKSVGVIDKSAGTFVEFYQDSFDPLARPVKVKAYRKRGLSDEQTRELQTANRTLDQIAPALTELARGLRVEARTFDPFAEDAARIRKEVDRILDTDYLRVYAEVPKK